ncbi:MAG: type II toxin-antitoxin system mRNA interferase toxin, RelE/StbE family [Candidatus Taylorbacteria bacterium]|nr:type II toxin-antitoxin system mRNA interferase toxin, RelE/StbE family [Candidatus Taylorbacteria bacterium]
MQIFYSSKFEKQYRKLPEVIKSMAEEKEIIFRANPFDTTLSTHKLHGKLKGHYAFSINDKYRIIFEFVNPDNIRFHYVGTHDVYE